MFRGEEEQVVKYTKAYVEKANLGNVQLVPIPKDLENWIEIDYDEDFNYRGKRYDVDAGEFIICAKRKSRIAIAARKESYAKKSDPLFIEWQYDQTPEAEAAWRNEVAAIKAENPIK